MPYCSGGNASLSTSNTELLSACCSRSLCSRSRCCFACAFKTACCARWCGENPLVGNCCWNLFLMIWWWFVGEMSSRDLFDKLSCSSLSSDSEISSELILDLRNPSMLPCITVDVCITLGSVLWMTPRWISRVSHDILIQLR